MKLILSLVFSILSLNLYAQPNGGVSGGGGNSIVCFEGEKIVSAELLDIYEGKAFGLSFVAVTDDFDKELKKVAYKLYSNRKDRAESFIQTATGIKNNFKRIPEGSRLELINDSFPIFVPKNCKIIQTANYYIDSVIWIDGEIFDHLSLRDQLALVIHETLYLQERSEKVADSRYARRITALAMSTNNPFNDPLPRNSVAASHYKCGSVVNDKNTIFFLEPLNEEFTSWKAYFTIINGHESFAMKSIVFNGKDPLFEKDINLSTMLNSTIDSNESIQLSLFPNLKGRMDWKGSHPGDRIEYNPVNCYKIK